MMTNGIKELKGSEILKIEAAVLEVMERAGFEPQFSQVLLEDAGNDMWQITFYKKETTLADLLSVRTQLGGDFNISLEAKDKSFMMIMVVADKRHFVSLLDTDPGDMDEPPLDYAPES